MASNSFGTLFRVTTWGESHGPAIGCVIDGCPAGIFLSEEEIQKRLDERRPGFSPYTSPRKEKDRVQILSGVFEGKTTGAPISLFIANHDQDSSQYESLKNVLRPGHANFTYLEKYGVFDFRGGGRASARETACRVAAGAVAEKILEPLGIQVIAYLKGCGEYVSAQKDLSADTKVLPSLFCLEEDETPIKTILDTTLAEGDSVGGVVECIAFSVPKGLGDPIYEKIEAKLALYLMSLPASKAIEFGTGVEASKMKGSEHNDQFCIQDGAISMRTNNSGGILGGITTGLPLIFRTHFKPTSSIKKTQETVHLSGVETEFRYPENSRHDPCVAIRAVPVCKTMCWLALVDAFLMNRT